MKFVTDIVTYYMAEPGRILGIPFFLIAVGMTCWLVYDFFHRRKRETLRKESEELNNLMKRLVHDAKQKETLMNALNEVRGKLDLPKVNIFERVDRGR